MRTLVDNDENVLVVDDRVFVTMNSIAATSDRELRNCNASQLGHHQHNRVLGPQQ